MLSLVSQGITQHIGAYGALDIGQKIAFLDTPGRPLLLCVRVVRK
jgi:translation initiation factor IF-2